MGVLCLIGAAILLKYQLDESSPWKYLAVFQLVIAGSLIIMLGHDWFLSM
jgi:hypothetical protein